MAKYLTQLNPTPPILQAKLKIHKNDIPIRPVVNNINAPSYKLAKYMQDILLKMINLPNTYNCTDSIRLANEIVQLKAGENYKMLTLDIKDLYVNVPTNEISRIIHIWLQYNNIEKTVQLQTIQTIETVLKQNYYKHNNTIYLPQKGIAMGSPISGIISELFLQWYENLNIKHYIDNE
jgi:hypothetical protein